MISVNRLLPAISNFKRELGLTSTTVMQGKRAFIQLLSKDQNVIGSIQIFYSSYFYFIISVAVSAPNLRRGYGRLLHIEAAKFAWQHEIFLRFPSFAYTEQGYIAFYRYPATAERVLEMKIPLALKGTRAFVDTPFEMPEVKRRSCWMYWR